MPLSEITTAIASIKTASDIAKTLLAMNKDAAINEKATELYGIIFSLHKDLLTLQSEYSALLKLKGDLEEQLNQFNIWSKTESQYKLLEASKGIFVRVSINSSQTQEPIHWLCTNCWEDKKKSIYQFTAESSTHTMYRCPRCNNEIAVRNTNPGIFPSRPSNSGGWKPGMR
jgi:DNA-directed RNA polymerase subunit RPC12/RpoP